VLNWIKSLLQKREPVSEFEKGFEYALLSIRWGDFFVIPLDARGNEVREKMYILPRPDNSPVSFVMRGEIGEWTSVRKWDETKFLIRKPKH